jgi:hypothetical protein
MQQHKDPSRKESWGILLRTAKLCEKGRKAESPDYWGITRKSAYIVTTDVLPGCAYGISWASRLTITLRTRSSSEEARAKSAFLINHRMRRISVSIGSCSVP